MEKIKWYQARWFWGAVIGVLFIIAFLFYQQIKIFNITSPVQNFFTVLPFGLNVFLSIFTFGLFVPIMHDKIFSSAGSVFFYSIYYLVFIFLIYKVFKNAKIKIIYPIIVCLIVFLEILSLFLLSRIAS